VVLDGRVGRHERLGIKWRLAHNHFVEEDTTRPPVRGLAVAATAVERRQCLWRNVVRRANRHR